MRMLESRQLEIIDPSLWILSNVGGTSIKMRDEILKSDLGKKIQRILTIHKNPKIINTISWLINNLCCRLPSPSFYMLSPFLSVVMSFFELKRPQIENYSLQYILIFSQTLSSENMSMIYQYPLLENLMKFLCHNYCVEIQHQVLMIVQNLICQ